jgi:large subunit ribosomal protein L4
MASIEVYDQNKKKVGKAELADSVFAAEVKRDLVHQVMVSERAALRSGNASTKTRGEVRGGGRKPYRQKGTGNARRGSQRSPIIVGGATVFGPRPRSYEKRVPKKMRIRALSSVLSDKLASNKLCVLSDLNFEEIKTKKAADLAKSFDWKSALFVDDSNANLEKSVRNIPRLKTVSSKDLSVYELLRYEWLVLSKKTVEILNERLHLESRTKTGKAEASAS